MIALALDTSGDRASVALGLADGSVRTAHVDGARRHAGALLPLVGDLLSGAGLRPAQIARVIVADGPGSFTGLRVGAAVAKALAAAAGAELWTVSTLLARAAAHAPAEGEVAVLTSALRGEVYAARFAFGDGGIVVRHAPAVHVAGDVDALVRDADVLVADLPEALRASLALDASCTGAKIGWPEAAPHAAALLGLAGRPGGAVRLADMDAWEPAYGRPAEAQARWELAHGRALPHPGGNGR